jgi:hypothetical protein
MTGKLPRWGIIIVVDGDSQEFENIVRGDEEMVIADKAYWSKARSEWCGEQGVANGILEAPVPAGELGRGLVAHSGGGLSGGPGFIEYSFLIYEPSSGPSASLASGPALVHGVCSLLESGRDPIGRLVGRVPGAIAAHYDSFHKFNPAEFYFRAALAASLFVCALLPELWTSPIKASVSEPA